MPLLKDVKLIISRTPAHRDIFNTELVYSSWVEAGSPFLQEVKIIITYYFVSLNEQAYSDYSPKWIIDGLKGHAFKKDHPKYLKGVDVRPFRCDKNHPRIEILLKNIPSKEALNPT